jgi:outer membrane protein OmpA-like peptidoglycan-associated protein
MKALRGGVIDVRTFGAAALAVVLAGGCANNGGSGGESGFKQFMGTDTGKGLAIGTVGGAALGAIIDHADPWAGVLVGAASGALIGGVAGHFMDQRKQDLAKQLQPQVNAGDAQIQMLAGNAIQVSMTGQTAFAPGSTVISAAFLPTLEKVASIMKTYGKMTVSVIGHPDAGGTPAERQSLANQRAEAVRVQLLGMGVPPALIASSGTATSDYNDGRVVLMLHPITKTS